MTGRVWKGSAFGGVKGRTQIPQFVDKFMDGKIDIDSYITFRMKLDEINEAFKMLVEGKSIRTVIMFE